MWNKLAWRDLHCTVEEAKARVGRAAFLHWIAFSEIEHEKQEEAMEQAKQEARRNS